MLMFLDKFLTVESCSAIVASIQLVRSEENVPARTTKLGSTFLIFTNGTNVSSIMTQKKHLTASVLTLPINATNSTSTNVLTSSLNIETTILSHDGLHQDPDGFSPLLFFFCLALLVVSGLVVAKIILSTKKNQTQGFSLKNLWSSRSSGQDSRLGLGGGPALSMSLPTGGTISLGSGSAAYTAMNTFMDAPQPIAGSIRDPRLDWERQFFDDDDEEHLTTNMEVEPHDGSRLELNLNH